MKIAKMLICLAGCAIIAASALGGEFSEGEEIFLLPVVTGEEGVPGAYGSVWKTEVRASNRRDLPLLRLQPGACFDCIQVAPHGVGELTDLDRWNSASLLYISDSIASDVDFSAVLYETSRMTQAKGISIPVVRESSFLAGVHDIVGVPADESSRVTLRIYDVFPQLAGTLVDVLILSDDGQSVIAQQSYRFGSNPRWPFTPGHGGSLGFVTTPAVLVIDISPLLADSEGLDRVNIRVQPEEDLTYWMMASVTDLDTQYVRVLTP